MTKRELIEILEAAEMEDADEVLLVAEREILRLVAIDPKTNFITVEPV